MDAETPETSLPWSYRNFTAVQWLCTGDLNAAQVATAKLGILHSCHERTMAKHTQGWIGTVDWFYQEPWQKTLVLRGYKRLDCLLFFENQQHILGSVNKSWCTSCDLLVSPKINPPDWIQLIRPSPSRILPMICVTFSSEPADKPSNSLLKIDRPKTSCVRH